MKAWWERGEWARLRGGAWSKVATVRLYVAAMWICVGNAELRVGSLMDLWLRVASMALTWPGVVYMDF